MNSIKNNPLRTRADLARAAESLIEPLLPFLSPGRARLHLGDSAAIYPDNAAEMEAYSRPLWAIFPLLAGGHASGIRYWQLWAEGLKNGTDPTHPEYWGDIGPYDQRMVEMAAIGFGMLLCPQGFWSPFAPDERERIARWLQTINHYDMPRNNWRYFRVLVNVGLWRSGFDFPQDVMDEDMALLESHYEGDGWYFDSPTQRDYYSIWEFQYDGLIYARFMRARDPERCALLMERGRQFASRFANWFAESGEALPYGRSLTYRFAQCAFFSALALCENETPEIGYGQMKHFLLGNLRAWFQKPIFRPDGVLSIGYGYPNQVMADEYNAPGSPYWGMKAFAALALAEEHPFWQAEETPYHPPMRFWEEHSRMLLVRTDGGRHVQAFTAGNHCPGHVHGDSKYEKFVYSTLFGFSVNRGLSSLGCGGFDSTLALSDDGVWYRPHFGCESFAVTGDEVRFTSRPFADVTVETRIVPRGSWHLRIHRIQTGRTLYAAGGGFALARDLNTGEGYRSEKTPSSLLCHAPWGLSGVRSLSGWQSLREIHTTSNTNLLYPRCVVPTLLATLEKGEHTLICAVFGDDGAARDSWQHMPDWELPVSPPMFTEERQ